ncbi:response regulator transcription factor [Kordia jejudonensis]|uniref:response regulator transcription factor n=1 Tax=Kordia jejudonensis TaxID=1348245 RepID=UPI0006299FB4|nr:response regulator transcription factor [Kordia jejudonensis]
MFLLTFYTSVFFFHNVTAQNQENIADSLISKEMRLFILTSDATDKIEERIQNTFDIEKDTMLGLAYCETYLERGKEKENYEIQYFAGVRMTYMYYSMSNYDKAIQYGSLSVKAADKLKDTLGGISSNLLLGSSLYVIGNYDDALVSYLAAKELSNHMEGSQYEVACLINISNARLKLRQFDEALKGFNEVLSTIKTKDSTTFSGYNETYLSAMLSKGLSLSELERLEEAEKIYNTGISYSKATKNKKYEAFFNINLGNIYYLRDKYHKSLGFLQEGRAMLRDFSDLENNKFIADYFIARNYFKLEKYDEALKLIDANFERIGDNTNTDKTKEMYQLAIDISKIQENKEQELFYLKKQSEVAEAKSKKRLLARELLYKNDIKDITIENEKLKDEKAKTQVDKSIILTVSIILVSLILFIFLSYHRKTKQKEQKFLAIIEDISKNKELETTQKVSQVSNIKDEKAKAILEQLHELESTHFYLSQDVTLHSTAKLLNTNTTYLSKALNAVENKSFSQYLNKLRIDYVLVKLKEDAVFRSYTIHAISTEIGYKSATTFIKEFKNKTGLNPSYYIKKIED